MLYVRPTCIWYQNAILSVLLVLKIHAPTVVKYPDVSLVSMSDNQWNNHSALLVRPARRITTGLVGISTTLVVSIITRPMDTK